MAATDKACMCAAADGADGVANTSGLVGGLAAAAISADAFLILASQTRCI